MMTISELRERIAQLEASLDELNSVEEQRRIFEAVVSQSPTGIAISDEKGLIQYANEAFTKILSYSPEEMKPEFNASLFADEENLSKFIDMASVVQKGKIWRGELKLARKDSQFIWIRMVVFPLLREEKIKNYVTIFYDNTNLKLSENARIEQESKYRALVENLPLSIVILDENGKVMFANELAEISLHQEKGSMTGKTVQEVYPGELAEDQLNQIRKVFKTGKPVHLERHLNLDGQARQYKVIRHPLFNTDRKVTAVMVIAQDITEQTRQDQMLNIQYQIDSLSNVTTDLKSSLDLVFQHLLQIDWIDCGGLYLINNEKEILELVYHTGLSENFVKNTSFYPFNSGNAKVVFSKKPRFVTVDSYASSSDEDIHQEKITFIAALPLVNQNMVIGLLNLASRKVNDLDETSRQAIKTITLKIANLIVLINTRMELKRSNEELITKLQELNIKQQMLVQKSRLESLGELLAGLAHEINQPLSVISLAMENISYKMGRQTASEDYLAGKFNSITQNINKIKELIDHVRIFSRDQNTIMFEQVDVNQVIRNAMSMMESQLKHHNIIVITDLSEDIGYTIGNPSRFEQVILNLLTNARDALVDKEKKSLPGSLSKEIRFTTLSEDDRIIVRVRDNGTGISLENLDKIFNPFFTTKTEGRGTGLGLPIVYGIIREMKGEITIRTDVNVFTEINMNLPLYKKIVEKK
jgi:PAS domain S-box-containing protein